MNHTISAAASHEGEIISESPETLQEHKPHGEASSGVTNDVNISKSQKTNPVVPEATSRSADAAAEVVVESRSRFPLRDLPFALLFIFHILMVTAGILYLNVVYLRGMSDRKIHNLQRWFPQLGTAIFTGSISACLFQALFRLYPIAMAKSIIWVSSFFTLGAALMLISASVPSSVGLGVIVFIFSICQSLYACWVLRRLKYAADLLFFSLNTARKVRGTYVISLWVLLIASVWLLFWSFGVVSALTFHFAPLVVMALLVSMFWTLEILRNVVCAAISRDVAVYYIVGADQSHWDRSLYSASTSWFGSICMGSLIVPVLHTLRVTARGLNRIHSDNEFMFSCADCFDRVTAILVKYANNWAYAQVALHRKAFMRASRDTYDLFTQKRVDVVIGSDLTSSFCVLSSITGGMLCVIVSGGWTFGTHKALTASVSTVSFFIGYFLVRIAMAVPQGAVCAHYVCYCEKPGCQELVASPVPERIKELLADVDVEVTKAP
ncbi:hypothetical protein KP509_19G026000 [Ceratopteris richardii]|nr:hypothetical protein KP509_19G026000 [Ceratopteris richardii]